MATDRGEQHAAGASPEGAAMPARRRHETSLRVPDWLHVLGGWGWRITAAAAGVYVLVWVLLRIWVVLVPLLIGLFLAAVLEPFAAWLRRHGWPPAVAAATIFLSLVTAGLLLLWWMFTRLRGQFDQLSQQVQQSIDRLQTWLTSPPLSFSQERVQALLDQLPTLLPGFGGQLGQAGAARPGGVMQQVLSSVPLFVTFIAGVILALFTVAFLLKDGERIGRWIHQHTPADYRDDVTGIASAVRRVMREYLGGTVVVGLFDAVLIGVALLVLGVPLVMPLAVITFFSAFVPVLGATVAGALSALVALASGGLVTALWVIAATIVVQQVEGNILQPLVMGAAVSLEPLVTLYMVTIGFILGGIVGAFLAVPVTAMVTQVVHFYRARSATSA